MKKHSKNPFKIHNLYKDKLKIVNKKNYISFYKNKYKT